MDRGSRPDEDRHDRAETGNSIGLVRAGTEHVTPEWPLVVGVIFVATVVRSAFRFGEALVAVPLLAFLVPIEFAAPLAALASVTVAALVLVQDWADVHLRSGGLLVATRWPACSRGPSSVTTWCRSPRSWSRFSWAAA